MVYDAKELVVLCNANAYEATVPESEWSPLSGNIYQFLSLYAFYGNFDSLVSALTKLGHRRIFSFDEQAKYALNLCTGSGLLKNSRHVQYLPSRWCVADPSKDLSAAENHKKLAYAKLKGAATLMGFG
ncbi:hypothetical protein MLD38_039183 [Melastoma candidum]|uniref:Uncharacterized protein n=1 Tax=Melastoma candidum TaxID=119954 RepID=A0ACB9L200_9MYRT|nr:hypothetical protein MLD38_039183 [Melastoma candidum]